VISATASVSFGITCTAHPLSSGCEFLSSSASSHPILLFPVAELDLKGGGLLLVRLRGDTVISAGNEDPLSLVVSFPFGFAIRNGDEVPTSLTLLNFVFGAKLSSCLKLKILLLLSDVVAVALTLDAPLVSSCSLGEIPLLLRKPLCFALFSEEMSRESEDWMLKSSRSLWLLLREIVKGIVGGLVGVGIGVAGWTAEVSMNVGC